MTKKITIKKLRNIDELEFVMPKTGVYLLSGTNGSGKTSLLACLRRIGHGHAFPLHFASSQHSDTLDNFGGASITYTNNVQSVTYAYGGERWVPTPRTNNNLLGSFGYSSVLYIGATADRITPRPEDFNPRRIRAARQPIVDAANRIFSTTKFNDLKNINLTTGAGNSAFLLQLTPSPKAKYVSERNFSLGELCILKLIRNLIDCQQNSLVLIDELELALHPRVQLELLSYLEEMAVQKNLTVIVSTHSVTLLKGMDRGNIYLLERDTLGKVSCRTGCYPTYILGNIAYGEERAPDVVIYVEDDAAMYATNALVQLSITNKFRNEPSLFPTVQVIPVGAFISVIRFLEPSRALLPTTTKSFAVLDADVKNENVAAWTRANDHTALAELQRHTGKIKFLPWTPEVGLVLWLRDHIQHAQSLIRTNLNDNRIILRPQDFLNVPNVQGGPQRNFCKGIVKNITTSIGQLVNKDPEAIRQCIFETFAKDYFRANQQSTLQLIGPMI
ncbi:MAG: AAA family ATPase [bacterium]|nr:AAA family ATPase [bacterium]